MNGQNIHILTIFIKKLKYHHNIILKIGQEKPSQAYFKLNNKIPLKVEEVNYIRENKSHHFYVNS